MRLLQAFAGAAGPAVVSYAIGRFAFRRTPLHPVLQFACGAAILSLILLILFLVHAAWPLVFIVLAAVGCVGLAFLRIERPRVPRLPWWVWSIVLVYGGLYLVHGLAPEVQSDALHYHLLPAVEAKVTGTFPEQISFYNVLPQGMELLFAFAYAIGGEPAAKLLHLLFLLATLPLFGVIARQLQLSEQTGWLGAVFYAVTPVVGITAASAYTDAALAFYTLAVFALVLEWRSGESAWLAAAAGLCAGFCYAIKFTGGWIVLAAFVVIVVRKKAIPAAVFVATASVIGAPWIARAAVLTGNPFAPLFDAQFPNPYFHIETIRGLNEYLRDYGGVAWRAVPLQLTIRGDLLQGLLGPAWLALPLALLSWRTRAGRIVLAVAGVVAMPWVLNIGTRFLIPALPLLALALMHALPRLAAVALLVVHLALSWPAAVRLYSAPGAWTLSAGVPWRVALGFEDPEKWRDGVSLDAGVAKLIRGNTTPRDRILDLVNAPAALTQRDIVNVWQTADGDRLGHSLELARTPGTGQFYEWRSRFTPLPLSAVRVRFSRAQRQSSAIRDIRFFQPDGKELTPNISWAMQAWPNVWDAGLALDRNRISGWATWEPVQVGNFWSVEFNASPVVSEIRMIADNSALAVGLELHGESGEWRVLPADAPRPAARLNLRLAAMREVRRAGITHVVSQRSAEFPDDVLSRLGQALEEDPHDWGLEPVARHDNVILYRIPVTHP